MQVLCDQLLAGPHRLRRRNDTPRDAAAYLSTTEKALENWRGSGAGPVFVRLSPKCIRYAAYDLDAHIWESRRKHTAEAG